MFSRRKARQGSDPQPHEPEPVVVEGVRSEGPWDSSERSMDDTDGYVDLGSLKVRVRVGLNIQMPTDGKDGPVRSVVLISEKGGLELRVFAAPKSGGLWEEIRAELESEVERLKGEITRVDGPFGAEIQARVPVTLSSGEPGFQPSRIVGVEGPRWLLRATFLGRAALEPTEDDILAAALRDIIVDRGPDPRPSREPLPLTVPAGAVAHKLPDGDDKPAGDGRTDV